MRPFRVGELERRRLMRLPQTEMLCHTRAWFFELS